MTLKIKQKFANFPGATLKVVNRANINAGIAPRR